ncbi:hypothetical protein O1611_g10571 [Lasiodiplodia mahajangana]|uniref:Uncharacterized protein n=1 Tax=Lasiodiplodia mahajangana TaxID=1108764 RepID=A0ACC2IWP7_9PEZI|nr:hypothetical protein O1611_g10571 [Lasiodiplodia mahajangana]
MDQTNTYLNYLPTHPPARPLAYLLPYPQHSTCTPQLNCITGDSAIRTKSPYILYINISGLLIHYYEQRNLNNAFAYDLVPSPSVLQAALRAARRVNDFPTAVRVFEGVKAKVENNGQYEQYLAELKPLREEFGIVLKEEMYPEETK